MSLGSAAAAEGERERGGSQKDGRTYVRTDGRTTADCMQLQSYRTMTATAVQLYEYVYIARAENCWTQRKRRRRIDGGSPVEGRKK